MAPVLLCPDCGAKHPVDGVNGTAFPCKGCGRTLKVPEQAQVAVAATDSPPPPAPKPAPRAPDPTSTRIMPASSLGPAPAVPIPASEPPGTTPPAETNGSARHDPMPSRWIRFGLWFIAVPLAFLIVFVFAKLIGVLTSNQVENVALDEGWNRFVPIARLLPFVALMTAALVHAGVYGITRYRIRRHPGRPPASTVSTATKSRVA